MINKLRIAAFGFRSIPMREGSAGADKFVMELLPRLVQKGHFVIAYNRLYPGQKKLSDEYRGVKLHYLTTIDNKGFDTLLHSLRATLHIIINNTADIVHIQNGGNSFWALPLRLFGKKVFISQDGIDWNRDKWPWYGKIFLRISAYLTSHLANKIIFDNIFAKQLFEEKFSNKLRSKYEYVPFGCEVPEIAEDDHIFNKLNIQKGEYFLFVGRFIPDKGLHYLTKAFTETITKKKLLIVGGSPNPDEYEIGLKSIKDKRIIFPGYIYGDDTIRLMKHAYAYIQPSDIEGLSPVILTIMFLKTPLIVSDIRENIYLVKDASVTFQKGNIDSLQTAIEFSLSNQKLMVQNAEKAQKYAILDYSWDTLTEKHVQIFSI